VSAAVDLKRKRKCHDPGAQDMLELVLSKQSSCN